MELRGGRCNQPFRIYPYLLPGKAGSLAGLGDVETVAEVVRYVNTASSGGDGTTNAESGAQAAYASLNAWEAAEQTDLVSDGNWMHVYCSTGSGTAADTTAVTVYGWTTDATHYILIEAADGDQAVKSGVSATRYRLDVSSDTALKIYEHYVRVDGLQIRTTAATRHAVLLETIFTSSNDVRFSNSRIYGATYNCFRVGGSALNMTIWNCIVESGGLDGIRNDTSGGNVDVYNSVFYACGDALQYDSGTTGTIKNVASFGNADDFDINAGATVTIDYCASDDGDGTNSVAALDGDWDKEYVDPASGDFTPVAGGNTNDGGVNDPGSGLYSAGMDGVSYVTDSWSIGVVQYVAAGGGSIVVLRRRRN